jgi:hypothetical protein
VGAGVAPNLAVYATLFDAVTAQPKVTVTGVTSSPRDWDVATVALGAGVAWYLMPWNFYLTLAAGAGPLMITEGSKTYTSHSGFVGRAGAGKEWFVSESWGLGAALFVTMATHEDQGADARVWRTVSPVLALSVTFY